MKNEQLDDGRWRVSFDEYDAQVIADDPGPFYFADLDDARNFAAAASDLLDDARNSLAHLCALAEQHGGRS